MVASPSSLFIFVINPLKVIAIFVLVLSIALLQAVLESALEEQIVVSVQFS
jgi:hypothetical protein